MNMEMILNEWIYRYDFKGMNMYEIIVNAYGYDYKRMKMDENLKKWIWKRSFKNEHA